MKMILHDHTFRQSCNRVDPSGPEIHEADADAQGSGGQRVLRSYAATERKIKLRKQANATKVLAKPALLDNAPQLTLPLGNQFKTPANNTTLCGTG